MLKDSGTNVSECEICGEEITDLYSWYDLKPKHDGGQLIFVCSLECLKAFKDKHDLDDYEIIEHDRCSAYFECEDIGNLRKKCERTSYKSYQDVSTMPLTNYCEPAQAGIIMSTYRLKEVLEDFSMQTEAQYKSNKEMMEKGAKESAKQFRITTWMTVLVIVLTVINLGATIFNLK